MKTKLTYTVRSTRAPGEASDTIVPVLVDRLQPIDLETVVENCIDRGLIAGLKPTAAHTIAEGVAAQLAREFSLGRGVMFGQYFYGRPYLSGTVGENGRITAANRINVRLYKGEAFKLTLADYSLNFDGSGDSVRIDWIMGSTSDAGGNTRGTVVANAPVIVQGRNLWAAGDVNKVTFAEIGAASAAPVEVTEFTSQGPDILAFAWPSAIESGKRYAVTVARTDLNGVTRTSSAKTVAVTGGAPAPTVERGYSEGMSAEEAGWVYPERGFILEGSNLSGASVNVAYRTLDGREGNYDVPAASVTAAAGSVTVSESGLSTLFGDAEAGSTVTFTVTTAGGTATYNGEVQAPV